MAEAARRIYAYQDYLDIELSTGVKHEFIDGHVLAMAGSTPEHADLTLSIGSLLRAALRGSACHAYSSDLKIGISEDGLYTYADAAVVCGPLQRSRRDNNAVLNAVVLVEVLSDTTEAYDRGEKFQQYQQIPSFREYVLVSQHGIAIDHLRRDDDGAWTIRTLRSEDSLTLDSIGVTLRVADIYDGVQLAPGRWGAR